MLIAGGKVHTYEDILALPEGERAELIGGEMFMMASPTTSHQDAITWFALRIGNYLQGEKGKCRLYLSSFAVFPKKDDRNYVEPDITVVCDRDKLDDRGCNGAPEWVIEIVSPSSVKMDYERKKKLYQESGVDEYWIVDLEKELVTVYRFGESDPARTYSFADMVKVGIYEDFELDLGALADYLKGWGKEFSQEE
ncbi:MAG: Uma2 family endonuclease [Acetatifactor sp.]|nr:Uma2 family endonuclease [Acetatifactor sp.]